jgi:pimeloyl-ACP methyl ester carboxylesterase
MKPYVAFALALLILGLVLLRLYSATATLWMKRVFLTLSLVFIVLMIAWYVLGLSIWLYPRQFSIPGATRVPIFKGLSILDSGYTCTSDAKKVNTVIILLSGLNPMYEVPFQTRTPNEIALRLCEDGYRVLLVEHRYHFLANNENLRVEDMQFVWDYVVQNNPSETRILVMGNSYGGSVAVKWALRQLWLMGKPSQLAGIILVAMPICFKDSFSNYILPKWLSKPIKQSTIEDISLHNLDMDEVMLKTCAEDINSLLPMNILAGKIPILLVYAPGDPLLDDRVWTIWIQEHTHLMYESPDRSRPFVTGIRIKNKKDLTGLNLHLKTPTAYYSQWGYAIADLL